MEEGRRNLAGVLAVGAAFVIAAQVVHVTTTGISDVGYALAAAGFALVSLGSWAAVAARRSLLSALGAGLVFVGAAWLAYVSVRSIGATGPDIGKALASSLYMAAAIALAAGAAVVGGDLLMARGRLDKVLGVALLVTTAVATIVAVIDVSATVRHIAFSAMAAVAVLLGMLWAMGTKRRRRWFGRLAPARQ